MPYFVFSVRPFAQIEKLAEFDAFKPASLHAKSLRTTRPAAGDARIKVMFADNPTQAEDQLCQIRDPAPSGDD